MAIELAAPAAEATSAAGMTPEQSAEITAQAARAATVVPTTDWMERLPEDLQKDPSLASFKDVAGLAKAFVDTKAMVGKKLEGYVKIPGEKATPEEVSTWRKVTGVPEKPDDYVVAGLDGLPVNQDVLSAFRKTAHDAGITPQQFQALVKFDLERAGAQAKEREARVEAAEKALRAEWGGAYDHKLAMVQRFAEQVGGEEFIRELELRGKDASPVLIKVLDKMAAMASEHGLVRGEAVSPISPQEAARRIAEIQADEDFWNDFKNPGRHKELVAEYGKLIHLRK